MSNRCNACGLCCKLFYINLSKEEYLFGKYKTELEKYGMIENFSLAKSCGANILAKKEDGSCVYLENNKCKIHQERPKVCGEFFCTTKAGKFQNMVEIIQAKDKDCESSTCKNKRKS